MELPLNNFYSERMVHAPITVIFSYSFKDGCQANTSEELQRTLGSKLLNEEVMDKIQCR